MRGHRLADDIIKGQYWENGMGCAVGCTLHSEDHQSYESELGIPAQLAYVQDILFEHLPIDQARVFPEHFLESIPVGADLYPAFWKFMLFLLLDDVHGLNRVEKNKEMLRQAAVFYERAIDDEEISIDKYREEKYEFSVFLAARNIMDALDPGQATCATGIWTALCDLGARERDAAVDAANYWDETNQRAVIHEWDEGPFRDAVAVVWKDKLLECLSQAQVNDAPAELPRAVKAVAEVF